MEVQLRIYNSEDQTKDQQRVKCVKWKIGNYSKEQTFQVKEQRFQRRNRGYKYNSEDQTKDQQRVICVKWKIGNYSKEQTFQ